MTRVYIYMNIWKLYTKLEYIKICNNVTLKTEELISDQRTSMHIKNIRLRRVDKIQDQFIGY